MPFFQHVDAFFSQQDIRHGHGPQLHVFRCQDSRPTGLRVLVKFHIGFVLEGALHVLRLKAQVSLHNDLDGRKGKLLQAPQPGDVPTQQLELLFRLWGPDPSA